MAAGAALFPVEKIVEKEVPVPYPVPGPERLVEVPGPTQTIYEERTVEVDNGKLAAVLDVLYDADGEAEFLLDDIEEDDIAEVADRAVFELDAMMLAEQAVREQAVDLLHKEELGLVKFDEDDIERVKLQDERGEIEVLDRDYDDLDAEVKVTVHFEQDDVKYGADFLVLIKEGEVDDVELDNIFTR